MSRLTWFNTGKTFVFLLCHHLLLSYLVVTLQHSNFTVNYSCCSHPCFILTLSNQWESHHQDFSIFVNMHVVRFLIQCVFAGEHTAVMQHVSCCRGVMIGLGNEPRCEQGGAQSAAAETCLPSGTERQTFVWQEDSPAHLHLTLTSLTRLGWPLSPEHPHFRLGYSLTPPLFPQLWPALFSCLTLSPSSSLHNELSSFIILPDCASPNLPNFYSLSHYFVFFLLRMFFVFFSIIVMSTFEKNVFHFMFFHFSSAAGTNWWLLLWSGHQPTARRFSAGNRSHSLHRDAWPHDFCHILCLQRLLCCLCWHQEWTSQEGKIQLPLLFPRGRSRKTIFAHLITTMYKELRQSTDLWGTDIVKWSYFCAVGSWSQGNLPT